MYNGYGAYYGKGIKKSEHGYHHAECGNFSTDETFKPENIPADLYFNGQCVICGQGLYYEPSCDDS